MTQTYQCCSNTQEGKILKLRMGFLDYLKALFAWFNSYRKIFIIEPGLYYTGNQYDKNTPLLITANYHLTVFLLWRIIRNLNVRLLVIDTKGINVWCASGKGQFSANEILKQLAHYPLESLTAKDKLEIILPKLSLSGVQLSILRKNRITPIIGPIYRQEIPAFLEQKPLVDRNRDIYHFNLRDRLFTLIPSTLQFLVYSLIIFLILFSLNLWLKTGFDFQIIPLTLLSVILYITFFPLLPTKSFSIKGISLALILSIFMTGFYFVFKSIILLDFFIYIITIFGLNLFFALYYTGNSGASNYSLVKKEIILFLPITFLLSLTGLILIIIKGVIK